MGWWFDFRSSAVCCGWTALGYVPLGRCLLYRGALFFVFCTIPGMMVLGESAGFVASLHPYARQASSHAVRAPTAWYIVCAVEL